MYGSLPGESWGPLGQPAGQPADQPAGQPAGEGPPPPPAQQPATHPTSHGEGGGVWASKKKKAPGASLSLWAGRLGGHLVRKSFISLPNASGAAG